jgi:hypothetical protein
MPCVRVRGWRRGNVMDGVDALHGVGDKSVLGLLEMIHSYPFF